MKQGFTADLDTNPAYSILLVDDDRQISDVLHQVAKSDFAQSRLTYANSFEAAVAYLEKERAPHLILLDIDLKSDRNGLDVLQWLRSHRYYRPIPVVILSVVHDEEVVKAAYAAGANMFTNKPYGLSEWRSYMHYLREYWFSVATIPRL
jgi:CheY-like chemotaxis protein